MIRLDRDSVVTVPDSVAMCPYCLTKQLYVCFDGATLTRDDKTGLWFAETIDLQCEDEYNLDVDYDEYLETHSLHPYVFWLPVENRIKGWLRTTYDFGGEDEKQHR